MNKTKLIPLNLSPTGALEQQIYDRGVDPDYLTNLYDILDGLAMPDEQYQKILKLIIEILSGMNPL